MMRHAISIGMGFGKTDFADGVKKAGPDDVLVVDPGEYTFDNGFTIHALKIRGTGKSPADVVIRTNFGVQESGTLSLENLTVINPVSQHNTINVAPKAHLDATRVAIHNQAEADYPPVYVRGEAHFTACEIRNDAFNGANGLYVTDGGQAQIAQCDIGGAFAVGARLKVQSTQIHRTLQVLDQSEVSGDTIYLTDTDENTYVVSVTNGSSVTAHGLVLPEGQASAHVVASRFKVDETNLDAAHGLAILSEGQVDIDVPGATQQQSQATTTEKPAASHDPAPAPVTEAHGPAAITQLHAMIGLRKLKQQIDAFIKVASFNKKRAAQGSHVAAQSLHSLFLGNPGTGKTTVARLVGKIMYENGVMPTNHYVEVSRQDLVSANIGGTAIKTQAVLDKALGGVLFIDEAYTLYQSGGSVNWGQEAVDTILKYMEDHRDDLMIIFAGYTKEMQDFLAMNPGLASRAPNVFEFEDYTPDEIAQIGLMDLHHQDYKVDPAYYTKVVKRAFMGDVDHSNGRWVRNYNEKLIQTFVLKLADDAADIFTIPNATLDLLAGGDRQQKETQVTELLAQLDGMIGLGQAKQFVHDLVKRVKVEQALGDKLPNSSRSTYHMIFAGPPGTGKTTVARIIAKLFYNLGLLPKNTVSEVDRPQLVGRYIGETAQKTSKAIRDAMGGVIFVDEAYQLIKGGENDFGPEAIETFITALENDRDKFVAIFAGYTQNMEDFLAANPGLRSRIPLTLTFEAYTPDEVAQIVANLVTKDWTVNEQHLKEVVALKYAMLPAKEQSNGRWARNYAQKLILQHELWLSEHLDEAATMDVQHIQDELFEQVNV